MSKGGRHKPPNKKESDQREPVGFWVAIVSLITAIINLITALHK